MYVNPKNMELDASGTDWGTTRFVEVRNTDSKIGVHSVWVKISANQETLLKEIEIVDGSGQEFVSGSDSIEISGEMVRIDALDADNNPCIYLIVYKLEPLASRYIKIKTDRLGINQKTKAHLLFDVIHYSHEPAPTSTAEAASVLQIKPPEELRVSSISYLKNRSPK